MPHSELRWGESSLKNMFLTEDQMKKRLERNVHVVNDSSNSIQIKEINNGGRKNGHKNMPPSLREIIAVTANISDEPQKKIAAEFNVTQPYVSQLSRAKPDGQHLDKELKEKIDESLGVVRERAIEKLMCSLGLLTEEKIEKTNAKDISTIAANMSRVVEKTLPKESQGTNIQLVVYAPQLKSEDDFKVVEATI